MALSVGGGGKRVGLCTGLGGFVDALEVAWFIFAGDVLVGWGVASRLVGTWGEPNPGGTRIQTALGDHPAAIEALTASHFSACVLARPNALEKPKGLVHIIEV